MSCISIRIQSASPSLSYVWEGHVDRLPPASPPLCVCVYVISPGHLPPLHELSRWGVFRRRERERLSCYTLSFLNRHTYTHTHDGSSSPPFSLFLSFVPQNTFFLSGMKITRELCGILFFSKYLFIFFQCLCVEKQNSPPPPQFPPSTTFDVCVFIGFKGS